MSFNSILMRNTNIIFSDDAFQIKQLGGTLVHEDRVVNIHIYAGDVLEFTYSLEFNEHGVSLNKNINHRKQQIILFVVFTTLS